MRADSTKAENVLWQALRNKQLEGLKFKRQVPLDGYILDFVCFDARLIVEVDGGQHAESQSDEIRDRYLTSEGFRVLRFWNNDVLRNTSGVLEVILGALAEPSPGALRAPPSPASGRGENGVRGGN